MSNYIQFDTFIAVDWSASNNPSPKNPKADALWVGVYDRISGVKRQDYFRTRSECLRYVREMLKEIVDKQKKCLIGYDLDFGFPGGLAKAMGCENELAPWIFHWKFLTREITDNEKNNNNRFVVASKMNEMVSESEGPFYGVPKAQQTQYLQPKGCAFPYLVNNTQLRKKRWCEHLEPKAHPVWKLLGTGSVGGQSLMGIPAINKLYQDPQLHRYSQIWPFTTGFSLPKSTSEDAFIMHCEIWPGLLNDLLDPDIEIRDEAQVRATVEWFDRWQTAGKLHQLLSPPHWLSDEMIKDVCMEEGWVIGSGREGAIEP